MNYIPGSHSIVDIVELMMSSAEWRYRFVELRFQGQGAFWVRVMPLLEESDPYFDFSYPDALSPNEYLSEVILEFGQCEIIDWSPGRLACMQIKGASLAKFASVLEHVTEKLLGEKSPRFEVYYEDQIPA